MKLIKIETIKNQNIVSVVEVPDIQCEEPNSTGQVSVIKYVTNRLGVWIV